MIVAKNVTNTVDVDFVTTIGAVATLPTFNNVGESIMVQWTGTDGYVVIGHGTGVLAIWAQVQLCPNNSVLVWGLVW